jgi:ADP-ribose pyrophosphatase YjhB (NUDIX family)
MYGLREDHSMLKQILITSLCLLCTAAPARAAASLTAQETRWLTAAGPVLAYSQRLKLPIDIVVQPQARPGDVPLAMGFDGKRCKLVLSMRGNPDADAILDKVPEAGRGLLIEAMTAHEVGHCWRYAHGVWHALPAGFVETGEEQAASDSLLAAAKAMRENRREEGYADLVALAWTARNHPDAYTQVYGWLAALRGEQPVARNAHDTRAWVALARDAAAFGQSASPFEDVVDLWSKGLLMDE